MFGNNADDRAERFADVLLFADVLTSESVTTTMPPSVKQAALALRDACERYRVSSRERYGFKEVLSSQPKIPDPTIGTPTELLYQLQRHCTGGWRNVGRPESLQRSTDRMVAFARVDLADMFRSIPVNVEVAPAVSMPPPADYSGAPWNRRTLFVDGVAVVAEGAD